MYFGGVMDISADMYGVRRERLRALLRERGLDALLVSHAANRFYLSGFELHDPQCNESAGRLLITADGQDWLCTDARYLDAAHRLWDENRIFIYGGDTAGQLRSLLREKAAGPIGIEADALSLEFYRKMAPGLALRTAGGLVEELRLIKDAHEIAAMERSCALNQRLMEWLPAQLVPGRTERELSWCIETFFRENGASELAFANIVAVGPNAALPHYIPGDVPIAEECPVLIDVGARLDLYCSDQTRTFWVGECPTVEFTRTLELVRAAQEAAIAAIRPGMKAAEVYKTARRVFETAGEAAFFTHGLGHGVGLETHEAPSLGARSEGVLRPGMVITVEPGLYYPQWGGVRWEYMVLVEEDGVRIL